MHVFLEQVTFLRIKIFYLLLKHASNTVNTVQPFKSKKFLQRPESFDVKG